MAILLVFAFFWSILIYNSFQKITTKKIAFSYAARSWASILFVGTTMLVYGIWAGILAMVLTWFVQRI